jgi:hypothetical protein
MPSTKNVSDLWRGLRDYFNLINPTIWRNSILHGENLIKADWLIMMGNSDIRDVSPIIISLVEFDSYMESDLQFSSDSEYETD